MSTLLNKTRMLNKILQKSGTDPVDFVDICKLLSDVLSCNAYIVSRRGKILGYNFQSYYESDAIKEKAVQQGRFPEEYNNKLLNVHDTMANLTADNDLILSPDSKDEGIVTYSTIVPIMGMRERQGTLLLTRLNEKFTDDDLVLIEYSATVVGLEVLRSKQGEVEEEARKKAVVQLAIGTLSYSELEAVEHIFDELDGTEGLLVASKIADKVGITRSVIVNALRKFESAGVIESRSLGMKGTHIKILNEKLLDELKKIR